MALIKCPECGKEISDTAKNCIHCGYALKEEDPKSQPSVYKVKIPKREKSSKNFLIKGITLNLCCLLISTINAVMCGWESDTLDEIIAILSTIVAVISLVYSLVLLAVPKLRKVKAVILYLIVNLLAGGYTLSFFSANDCFIIFVPHLIALLVSYVLIFMSLFIKDEK